MNLDPQWLESLLPGLLDIAHAAGRAIMQIYAGEFAIEYKDDRSPLTAADLASQQLIAAGLEQLTPGIPLLGEESSAAEIERRREWRTLWLVDPLDGTREFVKRNGQFTVNIALVHDHAPRLGVLHAPALPGTWFGGAGIGAWKLGTDGERVPLRVSARAANPPRVLASASHRGHSLDALLTRLGAHALVPAGSALKFAWLAAGDADFYPRLSPTSEWDSAAGQAIVEGAGGKVLSVDGGPLRCNARDTLINPSFIAFGDASRDWLSLLPATSAG